MSIILLGLCAPDRAGAASVKILDEDIRVPASGFEVVPFRIATGNAEVHCAFEVESGSAVRAVLLRAAEAERWQRGRSHSVLRSTAFRKQGAFRFVVAERGDYALALDNRLEGRWPTDVRVQLTVNFRSAPAGIPLYPSRARGLIVVIATLAFFAAVTAYAVWRLRNAWRRTPAG
jgi:hypothetical protein